MSSSKLAPSPKISYKTVQTTTQCAACLVWVETVLWLSFFYRLTTICMQALPHHSLITCGRARAVAVAMFPTVESRHLGRGTKSCRCCNMRNAMHGNSRLNVKNKLNTRTQCSFVRSFACSLTLSVSAHKRNKWYHLHKSSRDRPIWLVNHVAAIAADAAAAAICCDIAFNNPFTTCALTVNIYAFASRWPKEERHE